MNSNIPKSVKVVEVGPRDGLQNESTPISLKQKLQLVNNLVAAGCKHIEAGAFVSPKWVPQMADSKELFAALEDDDRAHFSALVPNLHGLEAAMAQGVKEISVFTAASETFSQKNINCSIAESLHRFEPVLEKALQEGMRVRGYVSTVVACPYEGDIKPEAVADVASTLHSMGCYEISLGETIGVATPLQVQRMIEAVGTRVPIEALAAHYHDTFSMAVANIFASLQMGISSIDSSVGGLGGCPYAPGASGNVATEAVVYLLNGLGIEHGINLELLRTATSELPIARRCRI